MKLSLLSVLVTAHLHGDTFPIELPCHPADAVTLQLHADGTVTRHARMIGTAITQTGLIAQPTYREPLNRPVNTEAWYAAIGARRVLAGYDALTLWGDACIEDMQDEGRANGILKARTALADTVGIDTAARIEEQLQDANAWKAFLRTLTRSSVRTRNEALALVEEQSVTGVLADIACHGHKYADITMLVSRHGLRLVTYRGKKGRNRALVYKAHGVQRVTETLRGSRLDVAIEEECVA